jgi:putative tricarboxylic transport membrane protein
MLRPVRCRILYGVAPRLRSGDHIRSVYDPEKRVSKNSAQFGHGALEGVAAPRRCEQRTCSGGFVLLLAFGLPTGPALAVLLGVDVGWLATWPPSI